MQTFDELDDDWVRALFTESPTPMALVSPEHRVIRPNDAYCRLVGYSRGELASRTWKSFTHPDDLAGDESGAESLKTDLETEVYTVTKRYITKSGEIVWVNLHVRAIRDGERFVCYFVVAHPIKYPVVGTTAVEQPSNWLDWCRKHPKDALMLGGLASIVFGRDSIIEILKAVLALK